MPRRVIQVASCAQGTTGLSCSPDAGSRATWPVAGSQCRRAALLFSGLQRSAASAHRRCRDNDHCFDDALPGSGGRVGAAARHGPRWPRRETVPSAARIASASDIHSPPCEKARASGFSRLARRRLSTRVVRAMPKLPAATHGRDGHEPVVALLQVPSVRSALARETATAQVSRFRRFSPRDRGARRATIPRLWAPPCNASTGTANPPTSAICPRQQDSRREDLRWGVQAVDAQSRLGGAPLFPRHHATALSARCCRSASACRTFCCACSTCSCHVCT